MLGGSKLFAFVTVLIIVSSASATYHFLSGPEDVLESDEEPGLLEEEESEWHYRIPVEVHSGMYEREDFAIKDTNVFDNRRWTIMLDNSFMIPVTGGYDRREHKMRFNLDERFPDRENNADLSGDGFVWTDEIWRYGFNPWFEDSYDTNTDGEWLPNVEQADVYGTDPLSPDTDGDGVCDETEVTGAVTRFVADHGEKGYKFYTSWEEITEDYGSYDESFTYATNPLNPDTDFSGLNDSTDPIPKDYDMNGNGGINHPDLVDKTPLRGLSSMKRVQPMYHLLSLYDDRDISSTSWTFSVI